MPNLLSEISQLLQTIQGEAKMGKTAPAHLVYIDCKDAEEAHTIRDLLNDKDVGLVANTLAAVGEDPYQVRVVTIRSPETTKNEIIKVLKDKGIEIQESRIHEKEEKEEPEKSGKEEVKSDQQIESNSLLTIDRLLQLVRGMGEASATAKKRLNQKEAEDILKWIGDPTPDLFQYIDLSVSKSWDAGSGGDPSTRREVVIKIPLDLAEKEGMDEDYFRKILPPGQTDGGPGESFTNVAVHVEDKGGFRVVTVSTMTALDI